MKNKILTFIIGVLVGAIITTAGFLIYEKVNNNSNSTPNGERPQMMEGENGGTPPRKTRRRDRTKHQWNTTRNAIKN